MSFSIIIKDEITKIYLTPVDDLISLSAYLNFSSEITNDKITIMLENASVARWLFKLIKSSYNVSINLTMRTIKRFKLRNIYILEIKEKIDTIKKDIANLQSNILDGSPEEKITFLKGVFLSCGSINDPKKNQYHLEFLIKDENDATLVNDILLSLNFKSKILKREKEYMVYIKSSENISDFIKYLNATNALFYFEDIRIYKDHKNMVNRLNNCEQANIEKSLKSSSVILSNIDYLEKEDLLILFDERRMEIIEYKRKYPDTTLSELANIITLETGKPISKSGINHHFREINKIVANYKDRL